MPFGVSALGLQADLTEDSEVGEILIPEAVVETPRQEGGVGIGSQVIRKRRDSILIKRSSGSGVKGGIPATADMGAKSR